MKHRCGACRREYIHWPAATTAAAIRMKRRCRVVHCMTVAWRLPGGYKVLIYFDKFWILIYFDKFWILIYFDKFWILIYFDKFWILIYFDKFWILIIFSYFSIF